MAEYKLRVSGNAIGELSEKIPSNIIALNELIKNSYDARANSVHIVLDTTNQIMTIEDDGSGMNEADIATLLQISKSTKKYGAFINNRYVQGSKGLGFLSVFKFGDMVTWTTAQDRVRRFSIDYNEILKLEDVSSYSIPITEVANSELKKGTRIEIKLRESYGVDNLKQYLMQQVNRDKILNSFIDNTFKIILEIEGEKYETKSSLSLDKYYEDKKLFRVTYCSTSHELIFEYLNHERYGPSDFVIPPIPVDSSLKPVRFSLEIELMLYDMTGGKKNNSSDKLFIDPTNTLTEKLTPLIYINKNLFNNYTLFDPEITRYKKSSESITQIIGFVEIITDDSELQFNSDRTQFQENELTNTIKNILVAINFLIQKNGSEIKNKIRKENNKHTGKKGGNGGSSVPPKSDPSQPTASGGSSSGPATPPFPAKLQDPILKLKDKDLSFELPLEPINLEDYIETIEDSYGNVVEFNRVKCELNGALIENNLLILTTPGVNKISYYFEDPKSGTVIDYITFHISEKSVTPLETQKSDRVLIPNEAKNGYRISFQNTPINELVGQLNRLYKYSRTNYIEVIACSLRSIFELSIFECEISGKIEYIFKSSSKDRLLEKVVSLVNAISQHNYLLGEIMKGLGLPSFQDFKNSLGAKNYEATIKNCHLGAHKSTKSLSERNLEDIGKDAALFLVIVNELINNDSIDWNMVGNPWKIEV